MAALAAASPGGDEGLEEDEDELEPGLDEAEAEPEVAKAAGAARGAVLTRRGITLRVLLRDGLLEPGRGVLSIYYLGKKFVGDLGSDGTITWQETGQVFNSPSAWATHCKRLVNPAKKSGCGWASVRYKGQKLDQYKAAWLRKHQPNVPPPDESLASEGEEEELPEDEEEEAAREGRLAVPEPAAPKRPEERSKKQQGKGPAEPAGTDGGSAGKRLEVKPRVPVRYCTLGTRDSARNPQTLVEVTSFAAINKFQPFNVAISSNVLLLLDFHSHLTRSEVVGYLGGRWDTNTQRSADRASSLPLPDPPGRRRSRGRSGGGDLPEPVPAGAVAGGVVPQPPLRAGAAVPARHRRADGLSAQTAGQRQRLPALPGAHLRALLPRQPRRGVQNRALLGDAAARATAQRLRDPHGCGGHLHPGRIPHQRRRAGDDAAGGVLQGSPRPGEVPGAVESGSDLPGQAEGLPGLPHPQRPELQPRPGADLQPAEAQRVRARGPSLGPGASRSPGGARSPGALPGPAGAAPGAPRSPPCPGVAVPAGSVARWFVEVVV